VCVRNSTPDEDLAGTILGLPAAECSESLNFYSSAADFRRLCNKGPTSVGPQAQQDQRGLQPLREALRDFSSIESLFRSLFSRAEKANQIIGALAPSPPPDCGPIHLQIISLPKRTMDLERLSLGDPLRRQTTNPRTEVAPRSSAESVRAVPGLYRTPYPPPLKNRTFSRAILDAS